METATRRALAIFGATSVAAFWVNAAGHVWMSRQGNPLVRDYKATLQYRSAIIGDSTLLPLINVLLDRQLDAWGDGLHGDAAPRVRLNGAVVAGLSVTAAFHVYQGVFKLTNWTMPRPWRWNFFGYYHALYMACQCVYLAYVCAAASTYARHNGASALLTKRLLAATACLLSWAALLYTDYY
jgi:hypothetical protein